MSNNQNSRIMEARVIIVSNKKSNRSENRVWAVAITGEEQPKAYCKSAYKAMRFAFLLKVRTGLNISENCLARLSQEVQMAKCVEEEKAKIATIRKWNEAIDAKIDAVAAEQTKQIALEESKPAKKQRKPRQKKNTVSAK